MEISKETDQSRKELAGRLAVDCLENTLWVVRRDAEEDAGGAVGFTAALFPIPQSAGADAKKGREFVLRKAETFPNRAYVWFVKSERTFWLGCALQNAAAFLDTLG